MDDGKSQAMAVLLILATGMLLAAPAAGAERVTFARNLSLSPDGERLAFRWAGDVWVVPVTGGLARRLTVHPASEDHPVWSRDGAWLAFSSNRHGAANVFAVQPDGGGIKRLTFSDRDELPTSWSTDNQAIYFEADKEGDVFWEPRSYRAPLSVGPSEQPLPAFGADPQVSPDGRYVAFSRGRSRWWRRGYRGSANHELWLYDRQAQAFKRLTDFDGTDRSPRWDGEGRGVYFISDRSGTANVWYQPISGGRPRQITRLEDDDVRDLAVSADGGTLAFTHWDKLYIQALPSGTAREIEVTAASDMADLPVELSTLRDADELEASPDGKELALVVRGEVFVIKTEEGRPERQVTRSPYRDQHVVWSPDGNALFFVSDRAGNEDIYRARSAAEPRKPLSESLKFTIEQVTDSAEMEQYPQVSPDGEKLMYVRGRGDLVVRDLASGEEQVLVEAFLAPTARWSPDSKWIAYEVEDNEFNPDVWIVPADGSQPAVNISQHPDYDGNPQWSADGQILALASTREGFDSDLYLVFLSAALDDASSVDKEEYFKKAGKRVAKRKPLKKAVASGAIMLAGGVKSTESNTVAEPDADSETDDAAETGESGEENTEEVRNEPDPGKGNLKKHDTPKTFKSALRKWVKSLLEEEHEPETKKKKDEKAGEPAYEWELDSAWRRLRRVTALPSGQSNFALAPDGKTLMFTSRHEGDANLYSIQWDGSERKQISGSGAGALHFGLNGKKLYFLRRGTPHSMKPSGGKADSHSFQAKMRIDHRAEAQQKFADAARELGLRFYHPTMKGLDWEALTDKYEALALSTRTDEELAEVFNMLQGELNASHMGFYPPRDSGEREPLGYLGVTLEPAFEGPGLRIATVLPDGPADRAESKLEPGDVILSVSGIEVGPSSPLERALRETAGEQILLTFLPSTERVEREVALKHAKDAETAGETPGDDPATAEAPMADDSVEGDGTQQSADGDDGGGDSNESNAAEPEVREIVIRPISYGQFARLRYDEWVEANRRYVEEQSNGRIGYTHIRGMSEPSFNDFERDLFAAANGKEGLIIDVRNNGGGWTADWVMAVLSVRRHAYTIPRGGERGYPQGRLIFYAWTKPATMMCNQYSYSNAEIVSHAFKNLDRGPLVGMPTFGAVISTGGYGLIDGSFIRMPFRGWYTLPNEIDMENAGARPDIVVDRTPSDEAAGRFPQLDAAIEATLKQIDQEQARANGR